jgi:hypothetical protein
MDAAGYLEPANWEICRKSAWPIRKTRLAEGRDARRRSGGNAFSVHDQLTATIATGIPTLIAGSYRFIESKSAPNERQLAFKDR